MRESNFKCEIFDVQCEREDAKPKVNCILLQCIESLLKNHTIFDESKKKNEYACTKHHAQSQMELCNIIQCRMFECSKIDYIVLYQSDHIHNNTCLSVFSVVCSLAALFLE